MAKGQKKQERTLETIQKEREQLEAAHQRIVGQIHELDVQIATGVQEQEQDREASLRRGYPAKASPKLRTAREDRANLVEQQQTIARLEARLDLEAVEIEVAELHEQRRDALAKAAEIEERFKAVEAELTQARYEVATTRDREHSLNETKYRAKTRLQTLDPAFEQREQAEYQQRLREIEAGLRKQHEDKIRAVEDDHPLGVAGGFRVQPYRCTGSRAAQGSPCRGGERRIRREAA